MNYDELLLVYNILISCIFIKHFHQNRFLRGHLNNYLISTLFTNYSWFIVDSIRVTLFFIWQTFPSNLFLFFPMTKIRSTINRFFFSFKRKNQRLLSVDIFSRFERQRKKSLSFVISTIIILNYCVYTAFILLNYLFIRICTCVLPTKQWRYQK